MAAGRPRRPAPAPPAAPGGTGGARGEMLRTALAAGVGVGDDGGQRAGRL
ncbi:hypothetical protein HS041_27350 [Planomonospora sp. ID67723]|nr:hypothetical protein [Planomonospora sp. ID67723]MBG0831465.1 hypothetical protein [Planomonospora sp. ID67723]